MEHDTEEKLPKRLPTYKARKGDGFRVGKCEACNSYTTYNGVCAICQMYRNEDDHLKYRGIYKPYEQYLQA